MSQEQGRRATDNLPFDFEALIMEEQDPQHRRFLLAFASIDRNLTTMANSFAESMRAMSQTVEKVAQKQEIYAKQYDADKKWRDALENRTKGWRDVLGPVVVVLQALLVMVASVSGWYIKSEWSTLMLREARQEERLDKIEALDARLLLSKPSKEQS